eukprot:scaffold64326_cov59-Phaeocystis_antarctica.AAC.7
MAVWPRASANCRAVKPASLSSSVSALARSSACTHASCPPVGRVLQQDMHDGEVAVAHGTHERTGTEGGLQVDARASLQQLLHHLQLSVGYGGVQQGNGTGCMIGSHGSHCCKRAQRVDLTSLVQPLDHLLQLASPGCREYFFGQRGKRAPRGLASVRWGGKLRWRCMLPKELRDGRLAVGLGPLQCGPLQ